MEEEIDLREYVRVLIRSWRLIAGVTLAAAVVALVMSLLQPTVYEATATVGWREITPASDGATPAEPQPISDIALEDLALDSELLDDVYAQLSPAPESRGALPSMLRASVGAQSGSARLTVRAPDPPQTARIANAWAEALVPYANEAYRQVAAKEVGVLEGQAQHAEAALDDAEQALAELQGQSRAAVIEARRASVEQDIAERLAEQRALEQASEKAHALQARLGGVPADTAANPADSMAALVLVAQTAGVQAAAAAPVQLSPALALSAEHTVGELSALIDGLLAGMGARQEELDAGIAALEPQLLDLQQQAQEARASEDQLIRRRDVAREVYAALAANAGQARAEMSAEAAASLVSPARVPARPSGRSTLLNVALAGMLGLMLAVLAVSAMEWWRGGSELGAKEVGGPA